jgi:hypothetical protein
MGRGYNLIKIAHDDTMVHTYITHSESGEGRAVAVAVQDDRRDLGVFPREDVGRVFDSASSQATCQIH